MSPRPSRLRRWSWFCIAALVVVALVRAGVSDGPARTEAEVAQDIAATVKCPTCRGQSVASSDSAAARSIRSDIERRVSAGESPDQIRAALGATYGDDILLTPSRRGFDGLVWALPVMALVLGLAGLSAAFARWRRGTASSVSDADRELVEQARRERGGR